jgi:hypothetical protein
MKSTGDSGEPCGTPAATGISSVSGNKSKGVKEDSIVRESHKKRADIAVTVSHCLFPQPRTDP